MAPTRLVLCTQLASCMRLASYIRFALRMRLVLRSDLRCGRDLLRGWGLRYEMTWVIGAISILLKTTLECGLFCVKDIE